MATVEERLSRLEVNVAEHSATLGELRGLMVGLDRKVDHLSESMERRFDSVERRFEGVERRFESVERRFESIERHFDHQDAKFSKFFLWVIMAQLSTLLAIVAGMFGIVTKLLP